MIRTYLFDFDGTLVDSMPSFFAGIFKLMDVYHMPYGDDFVRETTPLGLDGIAEYLIAMGIPMDKKAIRAAIQENITEAYFHRVPAKPHVISALQTLKSRGISLNVLTASPHVTLDACLKRLGMYDLFDNIWSCDDFGLTKSNPAIYGQAAERLGVGVEEVLFFDDNIHSCETAKQAGMQVCGVYDSYSADCVDRMKAATDRYVYDFTELL